MTKFIKNATGGDQTWVGQLIASAAYYEIQSVEEKQWTSNSGLLSAIGSGDAIVAKSDNGTLDITDVATAIAYLQDNDTKNIVVISQAEQMPFALPTHRTKLDGSSAWVTCPENVVTTDDFLLTAERYVSGGDIIYKDAKEGDYLSAEVRDIDGGIPSQYRAALCEAHPIVAAYVIKKWLIPASGYGKVSIDTYPLNAKITAGLYLRVSYHASSETGNRKMVINYNLTKKL